MPPRLAATALVLWLGFAPIAASATRPLDTEDTGTTEVGRFELELGVEHARAGDTQAWILTGVLSFGVLANLEGAPGPRPGGARAGGPGREGGRRRGLSSGRPPRRPRAPAGCPSRAPTCLTPTEYRLLATLVRHAGKMLTHRQLLQEVWGAPYVDQTQHLRVYMTRAPAQARGGACPPEAPRHGTGRGLPAPGGVRAAAGLARAWLVGAGSEGDAEPQVRRRWDNPRGRARGRTAI
jgi:hypothetical protein